MALQLTVYCTTCKSACKPKADGDSIIFLRDPDEPTRYEMDERRLKCNCEDDEEEQVSSWAVQFLAPIQGRV